MRSSEKKLQIKGLLIHDPNVKTEDLLIPEQGSGVVTMTPACVKKALANPGTSSGPDGWHPDHLKAVAASTQGLKAITNIINRLMDVSTQGDEMAIVRHAMATSKLIPLSKPKGGIRPIAVPSVWMRLVAKTVVNQEQAAAAQHLTNQYATGTKGGIEIATNMLRLAMQSNPTHVAISVDMVNAYGRLHRTAIKEGICALPPDECRATRRFFNNFTAQGSSIVSADNTFRHDYNVGVDQGGPMSPLFYALGINKAIQAAAEAIGQDGHCGAYLDDTILIGPANKVADAFATLTAEASKTGGLVNLDKTQIMTFANTPDAHVKMLKDKTKVARSVKAIKFLGAYIANNPEADVKASAEAAKSLVADFAVKLMEMPDLQCRMALLRHSLDTQANHLCRTTPPSAMRDAIKEADDATRMVFNSILDDHLGEDLRTADGKMKHKHKDKGKTTTWAGVTSTAATAPSAAAPSAAAPATAAPAFIGPLTAKQWRAAKERARSAAKKAADKTKAPNPTPKRSYEEAFQEATLPAKYGGLGLTLMAHIARAAHLASSTLVIQHLVNHPSTFSKKLLTVIEDPNSIPGKELVVSINQAKSLVAKANQDPKYAVKTGEKAGNTEEYLPTAPRPPVPELKGLRTWTTPKIQAALTACHSRVRWRELYIKNTPTDKANMLSRSTPQGIVPLTILPTCDGFQFTNIDFQVTLRRCFGLDLLAAVGMKEGELCVCQAVGGTPRLMDSKHLMNCRSNDQLIRRHNSVELVIAEMGKSTGSVALLEQPLKTDDLHRSDILFVNELPHQKQANLMVDVVIVSHSQEKELPRTSRIPLYSAQVQGVNPKIVKYKDHYDVETSVFVPAAFELGGAIHSRTRSLIRHFATKVNNMPPAGACYDTPTFSSYWTAQIQCAIARKVAQGVRKTASNALSNLKGSDSAMSA